MRRTLRRTVSAAATAAAVAAFPLVLASPAQATVGMCTDVIRSAGYEVGSGVTQACQQGARGTAPGIRLCMSDMAGLGVAEQHYQTACRAAAE